MPRTVTTAALAALAPLSAMASASQTSCPKGGCGSRAAAATDTAALLQGPPRGAWNGAKKAKKGLLADPDDDPSAWTCGVAYEFVRAPGYTGDHDVFGTVRFKAFTGIKDSSSGVYLQYSFVDADPKCSMGAGTKENSCSIQMRSGACDGDLKDALYNHGNRERNPWDCIAYTTEPVWDGEDDDTHKYGYKTCGTTVAYTGLGPEAVEGRIAVIYDYDGHAAGCAPISTGKSDLLEPPAGALAVPGEAGAMQPHPALLAAGSGGLLRPLKADDFVRYPGYKGPLNVWGQVLIFERSGSNAMQDSLIGQVVQFDLEGVDPDCHHGPGGESPNSCGIHVHTGETCGENTGPHFWLKEAVNKDPWHCVSYTATKLERVVKAEGRGVPALTGLTSSDIIKRALVVHDYRGQRIACAILDV